MSAAASRPAVTSAVEEAGTLLALTLDRPRGNVLDVEAIEALRSAVRGAAGAPAVRTLLLQGAGGEFSYGASVAEHAPASVRGMLTSFHGLFRDLAACGKVLVAAVRGRCLGGGLELAAFCHRLFVQPGATLAQPEVKLAVFAPLASLVLPLRLGQARADDLLLTGRSVDGAQAVALGLADEVAPDPEAAARDWHRTWIVPLSAAGLSFAVRAGRHALHRALGDDLDALERLYLDGLMETADAREGVAAFLDRRAPRWVDR